MKLLEQFLSAGLAKDKLTDFSIKKDQELQEAECSIIVPVSGQTFIE